MWPFKKEKHWYDEPVAKYKIKQYKNELGRAIYVPTYAKVHHSAAPGFYHSWVEYHPFYYERMKWLNGFVEDNGVYLKQDEFGNKFVGCAKVEDAECFIKELKKHRWTPCCEDQDIDIDEY